MKSVTDHQARIGLKDIGAITVFHADSVNVTFESLLNVLAAVYVVCCVESMQRAAAEGSPGEFAA